MKHKLNSSVERHMLANQKVWGLILGQGVIFYFPLGIYTSFNTEITK